MVNVHHTAGVFNSYSKFCREPTAHWLLCFCVSSVTKCQNDALTKVVIIGQNQIIKSLVNADCCFGLCLVISIQSTKLTASLNPLLLILSVLQWFFFSCFCFFWRGPSGKPLWPSLWHFEFPFLFIKHFAITEILSVFCKEQLWNFQKLVERAVQNTQSAAPVVF